MNTFFCPIDIRLAVIVDKNTWVYAFDAFYPLLRRPERAFGTVAYGNAHTKHLVLLGFAGYCGEIQVVLSVSIDAVGCPHAVRTLLYPRYVILRELRAVILPVYKVGG